MLSSVNVLFFFRFFQYQSKTGGENEIFDGKLQSLQTFSFCIQQKYIRKEKDEYEEAMNIKEKCIF